MDAQHWCHPLPISTERGLQCARHYELVDSEPLHDAVKPLWARWRDVTALRDDLNEIARHATSLREEIEGLTGSIARAGGHQIDRMQSTANEAVAALEDAVRRDPLSAIGISLGVGLLLGILRRLQALRPRRCWRPG